MRVSAFEEPPTDPATADQPTEERQRRVAGRYIVDRLVARGGMAAVYLAEHADLKRPVALKILKPLDDADGAVDFEERFRLEAQTLAQLSHPHIVTLHDFGQMEDGRFFLAMEYVDGPRFADLLRDGPMDPERAIGLILQVCQALRYAHGRGVIHRDLKPSNLLIRQYGDGHEVVKVVDFGLVKLTNDDQSVTKAGLVLGSPHCMSPEQVKGLDVDARTDIYAIGVLLFRSILGKYPFHGRNSTATMMMHLNDSPPTFFSVNPEIAIPEGLEEVVRTCLEKEPAHRYQSMDELIGALAEVINAPADAYLTSSVAISTIRRQSPVVDQGPSKLAILGAVSGGFAAAVGLMAIVLWMTMSPDTSATTPEASSGEPPIAAGSTVSAAPAGSGAAASEAPSTPAKAAPANTTEQEPPAAEASKAEASRDDEPEAKDEAKDDGGTRSSRRSRSSGGSSEARAEPKAESKPEPKAESKPEPKAESKPEPKAEPDAPKGPEGYRGLPEDF